MTAPNPTSRERPLLRLVADGTGAAVAPRRTVPTEAIVAVGRTAAPASARRPMPRKHKLMLLLAFELVVFGLAQSGFRDARPGIVIEISVTPNHVVT
ncbi:hypothetical protein [Methylobacterium nigriterrae]|uniref:hypothetical protein n=1 Tax=Methylobacterium nigriterrae TaxID=3127512 RepID=UPI00301400A3